MASRGLAIALAAAVASCGGNNGPSRKADPSDGIGPAGGQLASLDGRLRIAIPAGALATTIRLGIIEVDPTEVPEGTVGPVYRVTPEAQGFAGTVEVSYSYDGLAADVDEAAGLTLSQLFGTWQTLAAHEVRGADGRLVGRAAITGVFGVVRGEGTAIPQLSVGDAQALESDAQAIVRISASGPSLRPMRVRYQTADDTAIAPDDYSTRFGTATIDPGQTAVEITVPVFDDDQAEDNERFIFSIADPEQATISRSAAAVTILDDDSAPRVSIASVSVDEGDGGEQTVQFAVTLSRPGGETGRVNYQTVGGTATAGVDFSPASGTVVFSPGETEASITVVVFGDYVREPDETFTVELVTPVNIELAPQGAVGTATIVNDDFFPVFEFDRQSHLVDEGTRTVTLAVARTSGTADATTVGYTIVADSAGADDYVDQGGGTVAFGTGQNTAYIDIDIVDDDLVEGDESFTVNLVHEDTVVIGELASATVTIRDDDQPGTFGFTRPVMSALEGAEAQVCVVREGGTTGRVEVQYSVVAGSATADVDYQVAGASGVLVFADGSDVAQCLVVIILDDDVIDPGETLSVQLQGVSAGAIGPDGGSITLTIGDDESPGVIAFVAGTVTFEEGAGTVTVGLERRGGVSGQVGVTVVAWNGSATLGDDFDNVAPTVTFGPGIDQASVQLDIIDNGDADGDRDFSLRLAAPSGGAGVATPDAVVVTIVDDEVPGEIGVAYEQVSVGEADGSVSIPVLRRGGTFGEVSVTYTTESASASATSDFIATSGTLVFGDGVDARVVDVDLVNDDQREGAEEFRVLVDLPTGGATLGPSRTTVAIADDDDPGSIGFAMTAATVDEDAGVLTLSVERTAGTAGTSTVTYATQNVSASAGSDYVAASGELTFVAGSSEAQTIEIEILDDSLPEIYEVFRVSLTAVSGDASIGTATISVTIPRNDQAVGNLTLRQSGWSVTEADSTVRVFIDRVGGGFGFVASNYEVVADTAQAGLDFVLDSGNLGFAQGVAERHFDVQVLDNAAYVGIRRVFVRLSDPVGGATLINAEAVLSINEDDLDLDQIDDTGDNCPGEANTAQEDADGDGTGDACDLCPTVATTDLAQRTGPALVNLELGAGPGSSAGSCGGDGSAEAAFIWQATSGGDYTFEVEPAGTVYARVGACDGAQLGCAADSLVAQMGVGEVAYIFVDGSAGTYQLSVFREDETCDDGADNDDDGSVDCADEDCNIDAACAWQCDPDQQDDGVCDCGCGRLDPDCGGAGCAGPGCFENACEACYDDQQSVLCVPDSWTCQPELFGADTCICGCGVESSACEATGCGEAGCVAAGCSLCFDEHGISQPCNCDAAPQGWTCDDCLYGDGLCNCGCGIADPDCTGGCTEEGCWDEGCTFCWDGQDLNLCQWICDPDWQGDAECDCGCGAPDPDCGSEGCSAFGCHAAGCDFCFDGARGIDCGNVPTGWTCDLGRAVDGLCDCGCGAPDPDCETEGCTEPGCEADACVFCHDGDSENTCGLPAAWTCETARYADGICDCGCGAADADCVTGCTEAGCEADGCGYCWDGEAASVCGWVCDSAAEGDLICDCGCGAPDPDCFGFGCSEPGCTDGLICQRSF